MKSKSKKSTAKKPATRSPGIPGKSTSPGRSRSNTTSPLAVTFKDLEPNWRAYIAYADYAANDGNEEMVKLIAVFKALPKREKETAMPERLCELAGIRPSELVAAVCGQVWALQSGESAMAAAILHPKIVRKTAKAAESIRYGGKDRELFFRISGSLPDKKGTTIINNNNPQTVLAPGLAPGHLPPMSERTLEMDKLLSEGSPVHVLRSDSQTDA